MALLISAMSFSTPVGLIVAGPVTEIIGTNIWFLLSGIALFIVGIICCLVIKRYEKRTGIIAGTNTPIHPIIITDEISESDWSKQADEEMTPEKTDLDID